MADAKWTITAMIGVVVLVAVGYQGTLYLNDFRKIYGESLQADADLKYVVAGQIFESKKDKIHILTPNPDSANNFSRMTVTKDEIVIYGDGYRISGKLFPKIQYFKTYGEDEWMQLFKKSTKTDLEIKQNPSDVEVIRTTEYYASGTGRSLSGTGGKLIEKFRLPYDAESSMKFEANFIANEKNPNRKDDLHKLWYELRDAKNSTEIWNNHTLIFGNLQLSWFNEKDKIEGFNDTHLVLKPQRGDILIDPIVRIGPVAIEYYPLLKNNEGSFCGRGVNNNYGFVRDLPVNISINKVLNLSLAKVINSVQGRGLLYAYFEKCENVTYNYVDTSCTVSDAFTPNGTKMQGSNIVCTDTVKTGWKYEPIQITNLSTDGTSYYQINLHGQLKPWNETDKEQASVEIKGKIGNLEIPL